MTRFGLALSGLLVLGAVACADQPLSSDSVETDDRSALVERALDLGADIERAGSVTGAHLATLNRLERDIPEWNRAHPLDAIEVDHGSVSDIAPLTGVTAAVPIFPRPSCKPCPFIIFSGGRIGILRSEGPCRPGAGLERCFYTWITVTGR